MLTIFHLERAIGKACYFFNIFRDIFDITTIYCSRILFSDSPLRL